MDKKLVKVYATGLGCLLSKRRVFEAVPFRTHPTFIYGEDLWYYAECNDRGFEFWVDSGVRARHENVSWKKPIAASKKKMGFVMAGGFVD